MNLFPPPWPRRLPHTRRGSALAATMLVVLGLMTFLSIAALATSQFGRYAARAEGDNELMAAGDAGLEYLYAQWQSTTGSVFNKGVPPVSSSFSSMDGTLVTSLNSSSLPFAAEGITFSAASIRLANANGVADNTSTTAVGTPTADVPGYQGWGGTTYTYVATVVLSPSATTYHYGFFADSMPKLTLTRIFQVTQVPLFQAAIFYENKLEIHPGAAMTVTGLVHTNGDLWARGFNALTFQSDVSYVGSYHSIGDATVTKGWDGYGNGEIPGVTANAGTNPLPTFGTNALLSQVSPIDPFGGTDQTDNNLHKIIDVPAAADTSNKQIAYNDASLIITVNSAPGAAKSLVITDGAGNALSATDTSNVAKAVTVGSGNTFYDQRETSYMTVTTLDMSKLAAATAPAVPITPLQTSFVTTQADPNTKTKLLASGTVYIRDISTNGSTEHAIRLINGSSLGQDVTVASSNPVYIQGDYNTGGTGTAVVSNQNNSDGTVPTAGTYNRYSSAVMADAVTILSNSWTDAASTQPLAVYNNQGQITALYRVATPTTVNTAILSGDLPSNYNGNLTASGGAHNFPRFLEDWANVNFTYYGSLVEAFRSVTADSPWQTGNVYYWPNRRWYFDTNFMTTQPPGVPNGITYSRGRWTRTNG